MKAAREASLFLFPAVNGFFEVAQELLEVENKSRSTSLESTDASSAAFSSLVDFSRMEK